MNTIQIAGHLGADPETRVTPNGQKVTTLRVATSAYNNGKEETIWWRVTLWGDDFKKILDHMKKGSAIVVIGEMRSKPETYTDKQGQVQVSLNITAFSIKFSPFGRSTEQGGQKQSGSQPYQGNQNQSETKEPSFGNAMQYADAAQDDDMPF